MEDKPKRRYLTEEERIAKLEGELAAAKQKQAAKNEKRIAKLYDKREMLLKRRNETIAAIEAVDTELSELGVHAPPSTAMEASAEMSGTFV